MNRKQNERKSIISCLRRARAIRLAMLAITMCIFLSAGSIPAQGATTALNNAQLLQNSALDNPVLQNPGISGMELITPGLSPEIIDPHDVVLFPADGYTLLQKQPVIILMNGYNTANYSLYFKSGASKFWSIQNPLVKPVFMLWTAPGVPVSQGRLKAVPSQSGSKTLYSGQFSVNNKQWSNKVDASGPDSNGSVTLNWQPVAAPPGELKYMIYRSTDLAGLKDFDNCIGFSNTNSKTLQQPLDGKTYYYLVVPRLGSWLAEDIYQPVAVQSPGVLSEQVGNSTGTYNGQPVSLNHAPMMVQGRVFISLTAVCNLIGASVDWDAAHKAAVMNYKGTTAVYTVGSIYYTVNGSPMTMDVPPFVDNGCVMIAPRFMCEAFGWPLSWDNPSSTLFITIK